MALNIDYTQMNVSALKLNWDTTKAFSLMIYEVAHEENSELFRVEFTGDNRDDIKRKIAALKGVLKIWKEHLNELEKIHSAAISLKYDLSKQCCGLQNKYCVIPCAILSCLPPLAAGITSFSKGLINDHETLLYITGSLSFATVVAVAAKTYFDKIWKGQNKELAVIKNLASDNFHENSKTLRKLIKVAVSTHESKIPTRGDAKSAPCLEAGEIPKIRGFLSILGRPVQRKEAVAIEETKDEKFSRENQMRMIDVPALKKLWGEHLFDEQMGESESQTNRSCSASSASWHVSVSEASSSTSSGD